MGARNKPVDPESIDLLGKTKDARLVVTYAQQSGACGTYDDATRVEAQVREVREARAGFYAARAGRAA